jgi:hypothetical protein
VRQKRLGIIKDIATLPGRQPITLIGGLMKRIWPLILLVVMMVVCVSPAAKADNPTHTTLLHKTDIKALKMFSVSENHIIVFVTDQNDVKYRLGSMSNTEVEHLLALLKSPESSLTLEAKPVFHKHYLEVVAWK